ncbi:MAG: hypothetical protein ACRDTJ_24330, partial [Pseudonocardiaceae bacterium]
VDTVTALSFDRHGNRIWRDAHALLASEHARYAVGEIAVPYGTCSEPSNVQAGGGACPVRFRCVGCDHYRTTVAYLPDLQVYLDDLLRTRQRLAATIDGLDEWARTDATATQEEITRIRRLINRIKGDLTNLDETERAQIEDAVAVVRRHRAVTALPTPSRSACPPSRPPHLPHRPPLPPRTPHDHDERHARQHHRSTQHADPGDGRRAAHRHRAPPPARYRRARPRRRPRHRDRRVCDRPRRRGGPQLPLPTPRPAREAPRPGRRATRRPRHRSGGASLQADLLAAHERATRLHARVQHLEKRLSEALGEHAWRESGLGTPADVDALNQQITHLQQQAIDLRLQRDERDEDLAAARAATRELMARLNTPSPTGEIPPATCTTPVARITFTPSASELRKRG